jgi:hypothetical protein
MNTKEQQHQEYLARIARSARIIAIREHTLGLTNTCPQCEENGYH